MSWVQAPCWAPRPVWTLFKKKNYVERKINLKKIKMAFRIGMCCLSQRLIKIERKGEENGEIVFNEYRVSGKKQRFWKWMVGVVVQLGNASDAP